MKIVVLDGYALNPGDISWERIAAMGEFKCYDISAPEDTVAHIGDAEIIFTNKTAINAAVLDKCPKVKYVGVLATGYNVVDTAECGRRGITVTNIPTYGTTAVAQYTFALILELCHRVGEHSDSVKRGDWQKSVSFSYWSHTLIELKGKTLGIVGFGRIGQAVGDIALAFGMKVLAVEKYPSESCLKPGICYATLDKMLAESNFISLNCPLTAENKGLINKNTIAKMKKGAFVINTARGPLIEEQDLADALKSGQLAGAAVDVLNTEPPVKGSPLIGAPNCFVTPHIAWAARESRARLMDIAADNLKAFLSGKPVNTVS